MGYLSNRSINLLNAHSLLVVVSDQAKVLFSAAFFLSEGIPPWAIALLWAWHFAARLLARTGTIRLVRHAGLKASIILGALGNALAFFLLVPVLMARWVSFSDWTGRGSPLSGDVGFVGLDNYAAVTSGGGLAERDFGIAMRNNAWYVLLVVPLQMSLVPVLRKELAKDRPAEVPAALPRRGC